MANEGSLSYLIENNYGNFVVQKAINLAGPGHKLILLSMIRQSLGKLSDIKLVCKWRELVDCNVEVFMKTNYSHFNYIGPRTTFV
jgi:hypothetical protein